MAKKKVEYETVESLRPIFHPEDEDENSNE